MNSLLILGAGELGQVVAELISGQYDRVAFLDDNQNSKIPLLGKTDDLDRFTREYDDVVCAFGNNEVRQKLRLRAKKLGYNLPKIIHPAAVISPSADIGEGTIIRENVAISREVKIEQGCIINMGAIIDHSCIIGHDSHIPMGAIVRNNIHIPPLSDYKPGELIE